MSLNGSRLLCWITQHLYLDCQHFHVRKLAANIWQGVTTTSRECARLCLSVLVGSCSVYASSIELLLLLLTTSQNNNILW